LPGELKPLSFETDPYEYGKIRYHLDDNNIVLSAFTAKTAVRMNPGDQVVFTSVAYASKDMKDLNFDAEGGKIIVRIGNETIKTVFDSYTRANDTESSAGTRTAFFNEIKTGGLITASADFDGLLWCGLSDGRIISIDQKDNVEELTNLNDGINCILKHKGFIYAASGKNQIAKIDTNGSIVWKASTVRIPTMFPWWELDDPIVLSLKIFTLKGQEVLATGCGDNNIRFYSLDGELMDSYYFYAAVPDLLEAFDVNYDGSEELLAAGSVMTCVSIVDVIDGQGKRIHRFGDEGWTSIATVLHCFELDGRKAAALGVNHRRNMKLYVFENNNECKGKYVINDTLAGAVTGIAVFEGFRLLAAGTSQGFVFCYDFSGAQRWQQFINGIICDVKAFGGHIWVAEKSGGIYVYSKEGVLTETIAAGKPIQKLQVTEDNIYAITADSAVRMHFPGL
jgi:hypothetical protein